MLSNSLGGSVSHTERHANHPSVHPDCLCRPLQKPRLRTLVTSASKRDLYATLDAGALVGWPGVSAKYAKPSSRVCAPDTGLMRYNDLQREGYGVRERQRCMVWPAFPIPPAIHAPRLLPAVPFTPSQGICTPSPTNVAASWTRKQQAGGGGPLFAPSFDHGALHWGQTGETVSRRA